MNKKNIITGLCAVLFLLPTFDLQAQNTTSKKPVAKPTAPAILPDTIKIPKFTTRFGPYNGASPALVGDLKKLAGTNLIVTDQQGQKWIPITWMFTWNRVQDSDDIRTGRHKTIATSNSVEIDSTGVLPASWQNEIKEFLRGSEEFVFERIIIEHPGSKRKMYAPDLRVKVL